MSYNDFLGKEKNRSRVLVLIIFTMISLITITLSLLRVFVGFSVNPFIWLAIGAALFGCNILFLVAGNKKKDGVDSDD